MAPDAGWFDRVDRSQNLQPLVEVATDEGVVSYRCCYASRALVNAALLLLRPSSYAKASG